MQTRPETGHPADIQRRDSRTCFLLQCYDCWKSGLCACGRLRPQRTLYMSALITVCISLSLSVCLIYLPIQHFFISAATAALSPLSDVAFTFSSSSLSLMERREKGQTQEASLLSAVLHSNAKAEIFMLWLIGSALLKRVATGACACKLVFRDQGWLILHYEDEGKLEDLKGWVNLLTFIILYNSAPFLKYSRPLDNITSSLYGVQSLWFAKKSKWIEPDKRFFLLLRMFLATPSYICTSKLAVSCRESLCSFIWHCNKAAFW